MRPLRSPTPRTFVAAIAIAGVLSSFAAAEERWELVLKETLNSPYSETRHNALKQVDTKTPKGLKALWRILDKVAPKNPHKFDWYVKEGAYEALTNATTREAYEEILRILDTKGYPYSKEAIVHSIIRKIRKQYVKDFGKEDDRRIEHAKYQLRKTRGVEYFKLVLPVIKKIDRKGRRLKLIRKALEDSNETVRIAAVEGLLAYPHESSIPLLIAHLDGMEKPSDRNLKEWVLTRYSLEGLTGQYFRDSVEDWKKWWDLVKDSFSLKKRVEEEEEKSKTSTVVKAGGVEVRLNMKVVGDGYPLLVLPWRGYEPDYFRPYFHGIEEFCKVFYVQIPAIEDFKGLKRQTTANLTIYPTDKLAEALVKLMKSQEDRPESFAVLGHGPAASTLAMKLAAKFQKETSHLIFVSPNSAGKEYGRVLDNVEQLGRSRKLKELENGAKNIQLKEDGKPEYEAGDAAEQAGMGRALFGTKFSNASSPEVGRFNFLYQLPGGQQVMNDSSWSLGTIFGRKPPRIPVMVVVGERDPWAPASEVGRVAGFFKGAYTAKFSRSSQNPYMFETARFTSTLRKWLASKGVKEARPKKSK